MLDDHRHTAADCVEGKLIQLMIAREYLMCMLLLPVFENGSINEILDTCLVGTIEVGETEHRIVVFATHIQVLHQRDMILG